MRVHEHQRLVHPRFFHCVRVPHLVINFVCVMSY